MAIEYRPEIDGLRAVAIAPVVLYHAGIPGFGGGYVGVDVFFVISGYLIASIIAAQVANGSFSYKAFYMRRARRLLPALFTMALVTVPFAYYLLPPKELLDYARSLGRMAVFLANQHFYQTSGYFDTSAEFKPLLHTWSLAVEEQFYLLFPIVFVMVLRRAGRAVPWIIAIVAIASLAAAQNALDARPEAAFFLIHFRAWELLVGAAVAMGMTPKLSGRAPKALSVAGVLSIAGAVFLYDEATGFPGIAALAPVLGTAALIAYADGNTGVGRLLARPTLVRLGLISYSLYLWHQPILAFVRVALADSHLDVTTASFAVMLSVLISTLSYRFIELPVRYPRSALFKSGKATVSVMICVAGVLVAVGETWRRGDGFVAAYSERHLTPDQQALYRKILRDTAQSLPSTMADDGACVFWVRDFGPSFVDRFNACAARHGPADIILGDSHAMNVFNIAARSHAHNFLVGAVEAACRPIDAGNGCPYAPIEALILDRPEDIRVVMFHQSGSYLVRDGNGRFDSDAAFAPGASPTLALSDIDWTAEYLERLGAASGIDVVWLGPFQEARLPFRDPGALFRGGLPEISPSAIELMEKIDEASRASSERNNVSYVSLIDIFEIGSDFLFRPDCVTYRDADHFSPCGERILSSRWPAVLSEVRDARN